jgi:hypothetical protein
VEHPAPVEVQSRPLDVYTTGPVFAAAAVPDLVVANRPGDTVLVLLASWRTDP